MDRLHQNLARGRFGVIPNGQNSENYMQSGCFLGVWGNSIMVGDFVAPQKIRFHQIGGIS